MNNDINNYKSEELILIIHGIGTQSSLSFGIVSTFYRAIGKSSGVQPLTRLPFFLAEFMRSDIVLFTIH